MLFTVSRNDMGSVVSENEPKNDSTSAASVLFLEPVLPSSIRIVFGSLPACFKNRFSTDENA